MSPGGSPVDDGLWSDLDNSQQEADELQSQFDQGKETGNAVLNVGKAAYDHLSLELGPTSERPLGGRACFYAEATLCRIAAGGPLDRVLCARPAPPRAPRVESHFAARRHVRDAASNPAAGGGNFQ